MKHFLFIFYSEWKNLLFAPKRLFYVLVLPLLLFTLLSLLFKSEVPRDLPMAYIDRDQTQLSSKLVTMLDAAPSIEMAVPVTDESEAKKLIQQQKVFGFIEIPSDFHKKILQGNFQEVVCYTNGQFIMASGLISRDFQTTLGTFSAGVTMQKKTQKGMQTQKALAEAQPILIDEHVLYNPFTNNAFYLLTALLPMMLQMVVVMVTVYVLGIEFRYQQGKYWLEQSGGNPTIALIGKLLPYTIALFFVAWWMNFLLFKLVGAPLQTSMFSVTLMTCLLIIVYQIIGITIASVIPDFRTALTIGSGFTAIAFSFSVYTFPVEGLPASMQYLANVFPFTHFLEYYVNRAVKGIPFLFTWKPIVSLSLFMLLFVWGYGKFVKMIKKGGYEKA